MPLTRRVMPLIRRVMPLILFGSSIQAFLCCIFQKIHAKCQFDRSYSWERMNLKIEPIIRAYYHFHAIIYPSAYLRDSFYIFIFISLHVRPTCRSMYSIYRSEKKTLLLRYVKSLYSRSRSFLFLSHAFTWKLQNTICDIIWHADEDYRSFHD